MTWTIVVVAVVAYLALLLLLRANESRLIYFPGSQRVLIPPPVGLGIAPQRVDIPSTDGTRLAAWVMRAVPDSSGLWLLICHGNAGNLSEFDRPQHYAGLLQLGLNLLAFDYRGYGESTGRPSESGLYDDATAAYDYLRQSLGVPATRILVFGHSLGSAVAIDLVSRLPAAGLIVEGAPTSVVDRGQELYPYIPVRWIAVSQFPSSRKVGHLTIPKLFLHARGDEVIPIQHGRRLFEAAIPPKTFVELQGGHGDAFQVDSSSYFSSISRFISGIPR